MRHIKITSVDDIPADALRDLVKQAVQAEHREGQPDPGAVRAGLAASVLLRRAGEPAPPAASSVQEGAMRYVALGDSYTIGTSVNADESWPSQLTVRVPALQLSRTWASTDIPRPT